MLLVKNVLFTVLVPGTVAIYIPLWVVAAPAAPPPAGWSAPQIAAVLVLALGVGIYVWCVWYFALEGRGTPAPIDAPKLLVVQGLYRYVRNPMYIGVLLVIIGWTVFFWSGQLLLYGLAVGVVMHWFVVYIEEPLLLHQFGEAYARYCEAVGRWVPKVRRT